MIASLDNRSLKLVQEIKITQVLSHLTRLESGIMLGQNQMPEKLDQYLTYSMRLDADDVSRLVIWQGLKTFTVGHSCRLNQILPTAYHLPRVTSHLETDLKTAIGMELVILSNDVQSDFLYLIDGSHRAIARFLSGLTFQDVPVYLCIHSQILDWAYIPQYYRKLWRGRDNQCRGE